MIKADQPTIFDDSLVVALSSRSDGSMLNRTRGVHAAQVIANRRRFCGSSGVSYDDMVYQQIIYSDQASYDVLTKVDHSSTVKFVEGIAADGLLTSQPGVGLFLPVADCIATVLYDARRRSLVLLHLGRHSTLTDLLPNTINRLVLDGSDLADIRVWMSPSAGRASYRLSYFDRAGDPAWRNYVDTRADGVYIDMSGYNRWRCIEAGIAESNIEISTVDTMSSPDYYSHAGDNTTDRMAVLVMMRS